MIKHKNYPSETHEKSRHDRIDFTFLVKTLNIAPAKSSSSRDAIRSSLNWDTLISGFFGDSEVENYRDLLVNKTRFYN